MTHSDNPETPSTAVRAELVAILLNDDTGINHVDNALLDSLERLLAREVAQARISEQEKVDRFEVIDETGRAYVKGSIYGSPVSIELSYQDDGRTLKVFVKPRE